MLKKLLLLILFSFGICISGFAKILVADSVKISALPSFQMNSHFGYAEQRYFVRNTGNVEKEINLFLSEAYRGELGKVSRKFKVAAGEAKVVSLYYPIMNFSSNGIGVEIDGIPYKNDISTYIRFYRSRYGRGNILLDSRVSRAEFEDTFGNKTKYNCQLSQFEGSKDEFSDNWLAYTPFRLLIFYSKSFEEMPESSQAAIYKYVRAGGFLILMGSDFSLPDSFTPVGINHKNTFTSAKGAFNLALFESGFGCCGIVSENFFSVTDEKATGSILDLAADAYPDERGIRNFPLDFSEDELSLVSVKWLMLAIYVFAIFIGPINIYLLNKKKKKILVFVTVPIASAFCCIFILSYYFIFEESTLKIKQASLTLLDENQNEAITTGLSSYFSSSSRPDGLRFSYNTEIYVPTERYRRNVDDGKQISLDMDQHFSSGWIRPRVARYLNLRKIQTRRERVGISYEAGQVFATNGLGADISLFQFRDKNGHLLEASKIPAGARVSLKLAAVNVPFSMSASDIWKSSWYSIIQDATDKNLKNNVPGDFLKEGMYFATVEGSPFLRKQFDGKGQIEESSYVIGIAKTGGEI